MTQGFGELVYEERLKNRLTLRDFCRKANFDVGSWSKIERGLAPPPQSNYVLNYIAELLDINKNSEKYSTMKYLSSSWKPLENKKTEEEILKNLPVFFTTSKGGTPTEQDLKNIYNLVKHNLR